MKDISFYIHIPFCKTKCPYCDFYTVPYNKELEKEYLIHCIDEIKKYINNDYIIETIYFGGGTPNLAYNSVIKIIEVIKKSFKIKKDAEITSECNPCTTNIEILEKLKNAGVNRLSFGTQSFVESELEMLGREHSSIKSKQVIQQAKKIGFDNISVDLIIASPHQTKFKLKKSIQFLSGLDVQHVSAYILKIEKNTEFYKKNMQELIPNDYDTSELYIYVVEELEKLGFIQYEISNFCKPGFYSKHNLRYWKCAEYIGIGPSAHSYLNGKRFFNEKNIRKYISVNEKNVIYTDDEVDLLEEYIMLNLRLTSGINLDFMKEKFNIDINNLLISVSKFINNNLMIKKDNLLYLTKHGFIISNNIILEIIYEIKKNQDKNNLVY